MTKEQSQKVVARNATDGENGRRDDEQQCPCATIWWAGPDAKRERADDDDAAANERDPTRRGTHEDRTSVDANGPGRSQGLTRHKISDREPAKAGHAAKA